MTSYYIDPERCFEVPFRIPLPDKDIMATRLANIRLIMKNARERQSLSSAQHRVWLATRPTKYRDKAKAIMERGRLRGFIGDLTQRYFDYLDFHEERLTDLSPLMIHVPTLCPPLSLPSPCLFGPPKQGDFNEIIRSNLSWSQFAGPVPAGWRERFLHDRQWERGIERRARNEYSDKERNAEYDALESQRRHLGIGIVLQMGSNTPPPLQRKRPVPLPLTSSLHLTSPYEESAQLNQESIATHNPPSRSKSARQQFLVGHSTRRPSRPSQSSRQLPSLRVTIPGTGHFKPWLNGPLCDSPLSITGIRISPPSVLLNADAIRAYLDRVHGPHHVLPRAVSPRPAYQSPLLQLISSKVVIEISAERMPAIDIGNRGTRKSLFTLVSAVQPDLTMAPVPSITHELHIQPSRPMKREGSQESIIASYEPLKKPRLAIPTSATTSHDTP